MVHLRRALPPLTAIWLFCQIGTVALVPVALWMTGPQSHAMECACGHGKGSICPMHRKRDGGSVRCAMHAASSSGAAVLTTLVSIAGVIAEPIRLIHPALSSAYPKAVNVHVVGERPVPPDPPPPRA